MDAARASTNLKVHALGRHPANVLTSVQHEGPRRDVSSKFGARVQMSVSDGKGACGQPFCEHGSTAASEDFLLKILMLMFPRNSAPWKCPKPSWKAGGTMPNPRPIKQQAADFCFQGFAVKKS